MTAKIFFSLVLKFLFYYNVESQILPNYDETDINSLNFAKQTFEGMKVMQHELLKLRQEMKMQHMVHQSEINRLEEKYTSQIQSLQRSCNAKSQRALDGEATEIGFYAQLNGDMTNLGNNQAIVFGRTVTDIGHRYNNKTGVFYCDVPGTYMFYTNLMTLTAGYLEAEIVVNGNSVSEIYSVGTSSHYGQGSNLAILVLQTGDSVWVKVHEKYFSNNPQIHQEWSTFSGYLLRALVV